MKKTEQVQKTPGGLEEPRKTTLFPKWNRRSQLNLIAETGALLRSTREKVYPTVPFGTQSTTRILTQRPLTGPTAFCPPRGNLDFHYCPCKDRRNVFNLLEMSGSTKW